MDGYNNYNLAEFEWSGLFTLMRALISESFFGGKSTKYNDKELQA